MQKPDGVARFCDASGGMGAKSTGSWGLLNSAQVNTPPRPHTYHSCLDYREPEWAHGKGAANAVGK